MDRLRVLLLHSPLAQVCMRMCTRGLQEGKKSFARAHEFYLVPRGWRAGSGDRMNARTYTTVFLLTLVRARGGWNILFSASERQAPQYPFPFLGALRFV